MFLLFLEIVVVASIVAWLLSCLTAFLSLGDFKNYSVFLVLVFFILPSLFDILVYAFLYKTSKKHNQTTLLRKELRFAKCSAVFTLIFNVLWLPFMVTSLLRNYCGSCDMDRSSLYLFILYFELLSLTISSLIYYRASLDFRLAFKMVALQFRNMICRNAKSDPPAVPVHARTKPRDSDENQVNIAMFWNGKGNGNCHPSQSSLRHLQSKNSTSKFGNVEVNIVPFDETKYFGEKNRTQEDFQARSETNAGMTLDNDLGFHDINIVPYDQSC